MPPYRFDKLGPDCLKVMDCGPTADLLHLRINRK